MEVFYLKDFNEVPQIDNLGLVLGDFDGLHIGHCQLISYARQMTNGNLGVLIFDKIIKKVEGNLSSLDDKIAWLQELKVDYVFVVHVDENFIHMTHNVFVDNVLKTLNPIKIFCGPDFRFGFNAQGDVDYLKMRFHEVYVLNYVNDHNGNKISSSTIRKLIIAGDLYEANRWLGRIYKINGKVVHGRGEGKRLGFPTSNLNLDNNYLIPKNGVYVTVIEVDGIKYRSLTNIGNNPTLTDGKDTTIETYIFDFDQDIYDKEVSLYFYRFLRDEKRFKSVEDLKEQLAIDKDDAIYFFNYVRKV